MGGGIHQPQKPHNARNPIRQIAPQAQIAQRPLGGTDLSRPPREFIAEFDHEHAVAFLLVGREDDDAGEVVVVVGNFLFGEEAEDVVPLGVCVC